MLEALLLFLFEAALLAAMGFERGAAFFGSFLMLAALSLSAFKLSDREG